MEFVSANPTGPLHVGHGRGAAYGASLASILDTAGYRVQREYYVNDNGRQMDILAVCVWLRYLELCGERVSFPDNGYRGDYIYDIARIVRAAASIGAEKSAASTATPGSAARASSTARSPVPVQMSNKRSPEDAPVFSANVDFKAPS